MKELDLLKQHWKNQQNAFEPFSEQQLYNMIHKRSSSIVKTIFIISIIEFVIINLLGYLMHDNNKSISKNYENFLSILNYASYLLSIVFIIIFYINYKKISTLVSTKALMESILKTKKTVTYYIYSNLLLGFVSGMIVSYFIINESFQVHNMGFKMIAFELLIIFLVVVFILVLVYVMYRLLYGWLLKKLIKNYEELKKMEV